MDEYFTQTITLSKHSKSFKLNFEVSPVADSEIFLRFSNISNTKEWFYTFNSADVRVRKPFEDTEYTSGENYYPIVGGLFIRTNKDMLLQIFPKFPLGAGMLSNGGFELHLHRNSSNDDCLGMDSGLLDTRLVEHEFLITIADLNATNMWRSYLLHKNAPILFGVVDDQGSISLDLNKTLYIDKSWKYQTEYQLVDEIPCIYFSSLTAKNDKRYVTVLNICETPQVLELHGLKVVEERMLNEKSLREIRHNFLLGDEMKFIMNSNSGENVIEFINATGDGMIPAYHLKTYEIDYQCKLFHHQLISDTKILS